MARLRLLLPTPLCSLILQSLLPGLFIAACRTKRRTPDPAQLLRLRQQIEINGEFSYDREDQDGATTRQTGGTGAMAISYGITDTMDLVYTLPYQWSEVRKPMRLLSGETALPICPWN